MICNWAGQDSFDEAKGLTPGNLYYCKRFYSLYNQLFEKVPQVGEIFKPLHAITENRMLPLNIFAIPWGHHKIILDRYESEPKKALFYAAKTLEHSWSRAVLENMMGDKGKDNGLYERQGKAVNNFTDHLPTLQSKLVQEVLKENYDFGFATVEHEIYDEAELEEALTKNVTDLLLELGTGFAFLGRQKELVVGGRSRKIDLLFYHIRLRCYVVCELKAKPFEPEFAGKLNYYVNAVDELLKTDDENPTIGLLVCSDMDKIDVQWSFKGISTPMGVATYNNIRIKDALPSQEQLTERVRLLQKELQETKRLMSKVGNAENSQS